MSNRLNSPTREYRSGLERSIAQWLSENGWCYYYEPFPINYEMSYKPRTYTLDFLLTNGIVIEAKGRFFPKDRHKHLTIKRKYPNLDLRFVFSDPDQKIDNSTSKTYAEWCEDNHFQYSKGKPPLNWLNEPGERKRLSALKKFIRSEQDRGNITGFNTWPLYGDAHVQAL